MQITHFSSAATAAAGATPLPSAAARGAAALASRTRVAARAAAATDARHARLCRGQSRFWQAALQYHARWHWAQLALAFGLAQVASEQVWVSAASPLFFALPAVLPVGLGLGLPV